MPSRRGARSYLIFFLLFAAGEGGESFGWAQESDGVAPADRMNKRILMVPVGKTSEVHLQVTFFKPDGPGPFPLAVINHGKNGGDPRLQSRNEEVYATHYFLSRGYAVILPMLRGFAGSEGSLIYSPDPEKEGIRQAQDVRDVISYMGQASDLDASIDTDHVVVLGQSYGGLVTLALGSLRITGVRGLIVFAGGRRVPGSTTWSVDLAYALGHYGSQTPDTPSLWFYGENDSLFPPEIRERLFNHYTGGGAHAEVFDFGNFMKEAHFFLSEIEALPIWTPKVDEFLDHAGLPSRNVHPEYMPVEYPASTGFAGIEDFSAVPMINDQGREQYKAFLQQEWPRVFVILQDGGTIVVHGGYDPLAKAQEIAQVRHLHCQVYAIDDRVVWVPADAK